MSRHVRCSVLLVLLAFVTVLPSIAASPAAPSGQKHENTRFGVRFTAPRKWDAIALQVDEPWLAAKYVSEKFYTWTDPDTAYTYNHHPEMLVVAFVHERESEDEDEEEEGDDDEVTFTIGSQYEDYEEFLEGTYRGGGYYLDSTEEDEVGGLPVTTYLHKVEKLARGGPKVLVAQVYHGDGIDIAVHFEVQANAYSKIKRETTRVFRSVELFEREAGADNLRRLSFTDLWSGDPDERRRKRIQSLEDHWTKAQASLVDGWEAEEINGYYVLRHVDRGDAQKVVKMVDAVLEHLDDLYPFIGPEEYARKPIIRVCATSEEESHFRRGSSGWYLNNLEVVTNGDSNNWFTFGGTNFGAQLWNHWLRERDRDLWIGLPFWIDQGMRDYVGCLQFKGRSLVYSVSQDYARDFLRQDLRRGAVKTPREMMSSDKGLQYAQCGAWIAYLASKAARKDKRTRTLLQDYVQNVQLALGEMEGSSSRTVIIDNKDEEISEEEEERLYKERRESWAKRRKEVLDDVFFRTFRGWSDRDWDRLEKAYFDMID